MTTASFSLPGSYVLMLTANDGLLASSDTVTIQVNAVVVNLAPVVNAGSDRTIALASQASLAGTVSDDGLPGGTRRRPLWSKVSGPGTVAFTQATGGEHDRDVLGGRHLRADADGQRRSAGQPTTP